MKLKYFPTEKGGGIEAVNYFLDKKRVAAGTAKVLRGHEGYTRSLIKSMKTKHKTTMGVLAFEETYISEEEKHRMMLEFEELTFPGLDPSQYCFLWVEHTDKDGKIELNFLILKIELTSAKYLQPHFHQQDKLRGHRWQDLQNLKYGYSDPNDPSKQRVLKGAHPNKNFMKNIIELDLVLQSMVEEGELSSREEIISYIEENGGEVTRKNSKDSISVKLEGRKAKKLYAANAGIYGKDFTSRESLVSMKEDKERANQRWKDQREATKHLVIPKLEKEIAVLKEDKAIKLREKYPRPKLPELSPEPKVVVAVKTQHKPQPQKEEEITHDDRVGISTKERSIIETRIATRNKAKRERSQRVLEKLEERRERVLEVRRKDAERLERYTRSLVRRVQSIGKKIGRGFKTAADKLREEGHAIWAMGNPQMDPELEGEKGPKLRGPGG